MLSIVIPLYNEVNILSKLNATLMDVLGKMNCEYEIIYVDDGSTDDSFLALEEFSRSNSCVQVIRLTKNFGQTLAIQAGIDRSRGERLVFLDADLQNAPSDIPIMIAKMDEGFDVVCGWRKYRKDPLFAKKIPSFIGNRVISSLFGIKLHDLGCTLKVFKREVISNIKLYGEMHRLLPLYAAMRGASIAEVIVSHNPRNSGKTHYGWSRVVKVALDLITIRFFETYSTKPIYFFGTAGLSLLFLGVAIAAIVFIRTVFLKGVWVSPLLFISLFSITMGIQFILMGILAEIIIRIYYKSRTEYPQTYLIKDNDKKNG